MWLLFIFNTKEKKGRGWSKKSENVLASVIYGWYFTNKLVHSKYYEHYVTEGNNQVTPRGVTLVFP